LNGVREICPPSALTCADDWICQPATGVVPPVDSDSAVAAVESGDADATAAGVIENVSRRARTRATLARNEDMQASSAAGIAY
jgi:hypothetical protein